MKDSNEENNITLNNEVLDNYEPVLNPAPAPKETPAPTQEPVINPAPVAQTPTQATTQTTQPTIKPATKDKRSEKAKQVINASKNKTKLVIIIAIIAVVAFFILKTISGMGGFKGIISNITPEPEFKIDTGKKWADKYGTYIKDYFEELNLTRFDVSFIDFNDDGTPEMSVRYEDENGQYKVKLFQINNKEITETKFFSNSQFKLVYSSLTEKINWYIYIQQSSKYGAYTEISKVLTGKAKKPDIKVTNEKELQDFDLKYLDSSYRINYYEVKKDKYLNDLQTVVDRYEDYQKEAKAAITKLEDDTANWKKEQQTGPVKTFIKVGEHKLQFGTYKAEVNIIELGQKKTVTRTIVLRDGVLTYEGRDVTYTAYPSFVSIDDGTTMEVTDNNEFKYGHDDGTYILQE